MNTQKIETIDPEKEPEYVGAHSALTDEQCQDYCDSTGPDAPPSYKRCPYDATHTVVMADGEGLHEVAMCDDCGEPEDVGRGDRTWSGEVRE